MQDFVSHIRSAGRGLLGTWVKIPSFATVELLGHAGFDFVVIDMEHAPHSLERANELVFCAQAMGMAALVRVPDQLGMTIQPLLDGGADGLLVPRVSSPEVADAITRRMVFAPRGERGLGTTSRAGRWGLGEMAEYIARGDQECLRMIQLEDWSSLEEAEEYVRLPHVNGIFIGHGDLFLSSGKPPSDPDVRDLTAQVLNKARAAGVIAGAAAGTPEEARSYLEQGFSLVMVSNDTTIFGRAAAQAGEATLGKRM